jgi:hypothetical protein
MAQPINAYDLRRRERRDQMWPDSEHEIYNRRGETGFCTVPRTLSLVATLTKLIGKGDPSRVYLDLWMWQRDDGFVEILDPIEMAASAGLSGNRAVKGWKSKLDELERLGFVRIKGKGNQRHKFILLLHPHDVVLRIQRDSPGLIPADWWSYFELRIQDIGAKLERGPKLAAEGGEGATAEQEFEKKTALGKG